MAACYAPDAHFSDPVFTDLRGERARRDVADADVRRRSELRVELLEHAADDATGTARWRAHYVFTQTGRPVVNDVRATFRFADGLIAEHTDAFSFRRWSRQALGPPGVLIGWTPSRKPCATRRREPRALRGAQSVTSTRPLCGTRPRMAA